MSLQYNYSQTCLWGHLQFLKKVSAMTRCPLYRVLDFLGKTDNRNYGKGLFFSNDPGKQYK